MTIFEQATATMREIVTETKDMRQGTIPSVYALSGLQAQVFDLYYQLGQEEGRLFSTKEKAILERKCSAARHHLKGRMELSMTQEDARQDAIEKTQSELEAENAAKDLYEQCRILRDSLDRAFSFLAQTIATVKTLENRSSYQP